MSNRVRVPRTDWIDGKLGNAAPDFRTATVGPAGARTLSVCVYPVDVVSGLHVFQQMPAGCYLFWVQTERASKKYSAWLFQIMDYSSRSQCCYLDQLGNNIQGILFLHICGILIKILFDLGGLLGKHEFTKCVEIWHGSFMDPCRLLLGSSVL